MSKNISFLDNLEKSQLNGMWDSNPTPPRYSPFKVSQVVVSPGVHPDTRTPIVTFLNCQRTIEPTFMILGDPIPIYPLYRGKFPCQWTVSELRQFG